MAIYFARKAGNINATDVWATTPSGTASAVTFATGDVLMANSFTITVNVSINLGSTGEVRSDTANGATANGAFNLANGVTLTANVFSGSGICVNFGGASPNVATIVGNVRGGNSNESRGAQNSSTGTLTIEGNVTGGSGSTGNAFGANNNASGELIITGNVTGGNGNQTAYGANNNSTGTITITGNVTGGSAGNSSGIHNNSTGTITITGNVTGGTGHTTSYGANNNSTGTITITGNAIGGIGGSAYGANNASIGTVTIIGNATGGSVSTSYGANNSSSGTLTVTGVSTGGIGSGASGVNGANFSGVINLGRASGNGFGIGSTGISAAVGASISQSHICYIKEIAYGSRGMSPTSGPVFIQPNVENIAIFQQYPAGNKTLSDPINTAGLSPAVTDVRSGVIYNNGNDTGTCAVPAAGSVALGVPVDAAYGTAVLTPAAVWEYATRTITGGTVTTLTNAPTVPSASAIASQVRTELSVELGRVDQNISSRLAAADYVAPSAAPSAATVASAVRTELSSELTKVSALNTERLANVPTVNILGTLLAQANS